MHEVLQHLRRDEEQFVSLRRDLHQNPELSFEEFRTSDIVASKLEEWGYKVERGIGTTGVVGQLSLGDGQRSIGLRADMDALPITEATSLPYASRNAGVMHACGHDGHTTMLLAAAKAIAERKNFNGTVNLFFQPAEETGTANCGAAKMIADGLFEKYPVDAVYGMHNMPGWSQGQFVFATGPMAACSDKVTITLHGRGGHGAMPQKAVDPIVAGSSIVMALQTIVARNTSPLETAVITVGVFQAGTVSNIIPESATLELTVRALNNEVREMLKKRITDIVNAQASSFGLTAEIDYVRGYPPLTNSADETELARSVGAELVGEDGIIRQTDPMTGSEDFAFMLAEKPGSYLLIGNGVGDEHGGCAVHNPGYDFNDANIVPGAAFWTLLTERYLDQKSPKSQNEGLPV